MNSIIFLKDNNNLSVNTTIVAKSLQVDEINVSNDIYVNNSIYTPVGSIITYAGSMFQMDGYYVMVLK